MRLDKFLKVSRLIKRRTVANEACDASAEAGRYDEEGKSRGIVPVFVEKEKRKA